MRSPHRHDAAAISLFLVCGNLTLLGSIARITTLHFQSILSGGEVGARAEAAIRLLGNVVAYTNVLQTSQGKQLRGGSWLMVDM